MAERPASPLAREALEALVEEDATTGCWAWLGSRSAGVHHRLIFELAGGESLAGRVLRPLCATPRCVRPEHFRVETYREMIAQTNSPIGRHIRASRCVPHDLETTPRSRAASPLRAHEALEALVEVTSDGCWLGSRSAGAHRRLVWEILHGEPLGWRVLRQLCSTRRCVSPEHFRAETRRELVLASASPVARNMRATQCVRGHSLIDPTNVHYGRCRTCRACLRLRQRRRRARLREAQSTSI